MVLKWHPPPLLLKKRGFETIETLWRRPPSGILVKFGSMEYEKEEEKEKKSFRVKKAPKSRLCFYLMISIH